MTLEPNDCPYCESEDTYLREDATGLCRVVCPFCELGGPLVQSSELAIREWNQLRFEEGE